MIIGIIRFSSLSIFISNAYVIFIAWAFLIEGSIRFYRGKNRIPYATTMYICFKSLNLHPR